MPALNWLTEAEAAAYLKISPRLLKTRARRGILPGHCIPGGSRKPLWRFLQHELDSALLGPAAALPIGEESSVRHDTKIRPASAVEAIARQPTTSHADAERTVRALVARYQQERMPTRLSTARVYRSFFKNHILPRWGEVQISDVQPRPFVLWLRKLDLAPKTRTHLRFLMHVVFEFAMWAGVLSAERNPISLVRNDGATKRVRQPRSLTAGEFKAFTKELREPFATLAFLSVCLGLRVSEALALRWSDVDWSGSRVTIARAIVNQNVDAVKTRTSEQTREVSTEVIQRLRAWADSTLYSARTDWIFASPLQGGRKPYSYHGVWRETMRAGKAAGVGHLGTHTLRHTFRSWLDAIGAKPSVQQKMMRHADIRTTMNIYGDVVTDEESDAAAKVSGLAFS